MNTNFMKLRDIMRTQNVTYYLVPSEDPHQSEYVDDHFKCRQYISGFTGSAGFWSKIFTQMMFLEQAGLLSLLPTERKLRNFPKNVALIFVLIYIL